MSDVPLIITSSSLSVEVFIFFRDLKTIKDKNKHHTAATRR